MRRTRKARKAKQTDRLTPVRFLRRLGIRHMLSERAAEAYHRNACLAGGDPFAIMKYGAFSPQADDYRYITEDTGKRYLSGEYGRLLGLLRSFDRLEGYPSRPQRVADLGGGTGVVALYLAARHPAARVVVYDHSPRPLSLGRKWAREQRLGNVAYVKANYPQLAGGQEEIGRAHV